MRSGAGVRAWRTWLVAGVALLLAVLLVAPLGPGSPTSAQAADGESTERCAELVVLGARASGQRLTGADRQMGPEVHAMARDAVRRLAGEVSVRLEGVPYPAVPTSRGTAAYDASVREGADMLRGELVDLLDTCPRTRVALAGFSQGAHVVHRTLARLGLSPGRIRRVAAVALVADPTYDGQAAPGRRVRYGVPGPAQDGLLGAGELLPPGLAARTVDFCHADDLVCSFGGPQGQIWMARWAGRPHSAFYEQPDTVAVNGRALADMVRQGLR